MASVSTVNTNGLSFSGLASGIDTDSIIKGLTSINQQKIDALKANQADIVSKQTTFVALQAKIFDLQSKTNALARSAGGAFDGRKATSSDPTSVAVAAGTAAVPGTYSLSVLSLAQANQTASLGFNDPNAQIKQGTLTVQVGSGTATTVTIDSRNNTLQGLADSINAAGADVRASIVNDGSSTPYRLMLTSTRTGAANTIAITNNLTDGAGSDIDPAATTVQAAADAQVKIGSGPGAMTVSSATNQLTGLIPGVSVNLLQADPTKSITLTVSNDTDASTNAIQDFVDSYNAVQDYITDQTSFDKDTGQAGILLGNRDASELADDLSSALSASIPGLSSGANRLSSVGLSFDDKGDLQLDTDKLSQALNDPSSSAMTNLKRLFGLTGASDSPGVQFVFGTDQTKPSSGSGYQVQVTAPATRAVVTATGPLGAAVTISPPNNTLLMKVNNLTSSGITLDPGTYSSDDLIAMIQQKINSSPGLNGNLVSVGLDGDGKLQISSQQYGATSQVSFAGGTAFAALGFSGSESSTGTDVVGNFLANGQIEAATGSGQALTGNSGNANTSGLQVKATMTTAGSANLTVSQGLASRLNEVIGKYLDPTNGRFKTISDGYQQNIDDINTTIDKQNTVLNDKTTQLQQQFADMESAINQLKGLQTQLSSLLPTISSSH